jgi:hypothetical protein
MARAVTSVPQPLSRVPIALTQPMINPATARVWAVCEEEVAAAPEAEEEAVPEAGEETMPEAGEEAEAEGWVTGWSGAGEAVLFRIKKRPTRTAARMPVITLNITKARRHARNRTLRRSLCSKPSKLALSGWCASPPLVTVIAKPARLPNRAALKSGRYEPSTHALAGSMQATGVMA